MIKSSKFENEIKIDLTKSKNNFQKNMDILMKKNKYERIIQSTKNNRKEVNNRNIDHLDFYKKSEKVSKSEEIIEKKVSFDRNSDIIEKNKKINNNSYEEYINQIERTVSSSIKMLCYYKLEDLDYSETIKYLKHYNLVTSRLKLHLKKIDTHPLAFCIFNFEKLFIEKKTKHLQNYCYNLEKFIVEIAKDINNFSNFIVNGLYNLYFFESIRNNLKIFLFTKENFNCFILKIIFTKEMSTIFLNAMDIYYKENQIKFNKNANLLKEKNIDFFIKNKKFTLNEKTDKYLRKIKRKIKESLEENPQESANENLKIENEFIFEKISLETKEIDLEKEINLDETENSEKIPYYYSIKNLENLQNFLSPIDKLKVLMTTSELILKEIKSFYSKRNCFYENSIDSDDILSIFIYIVVNCKDVKFVTQCNLIELFLPEKASFSIAGYYFFTFKASVEYLINYQDNN